MLPLLVLLGTIAGAWYLLIVRPQKEQQTRHGQLVERLQVGDHVLTVGGIYGRVVAVEGPSVVLELAPGLTSRIATDGIARIVHGGDGTLPTHAQAPVSSQEPPTALDTAMHHHPNPDQQQAPQHAAPQYHAPTQPWSGQQVQPPVELPAPPAQYAAPAPVAAPISVVPAYEPRPWGDVVPVNHAPQPMLAPPQYAHAQPGGQALQYAHAGPQPVGQPLQYAQPAPQYAQPAPQYAQPAPQYAQPAPQYAQPAPQPVGQPLQYAPALQQRAAPAPFVPVGAAIPSPPPLPMPLVRPFAEPPRAPQHPAPVGAAVPAHAVAVVPHAQPHVQPGVQPQLVPAHLSPAHALQPVHAEPEQVADEGRRHSRAPQGMGSSLRLDDPSLHDTMARARDEREELAGEYRKLTAPLVDVGTQQGLPPSHAPAHQELHAPPGTTFVGHDPNGVPLYAAPGAPTAHPVAMYPVPARPEAAAMPRPVVQAPGTAVDPALSASAFQRRTPYAPDPALHPQGAQQAQPALA